MKHYPRTEQHLHRVIQILEGLLESQDSLTAVRMREGRMANIRAIRRAMQRLDKTDPKGRKKFWKLSRRAVFLAAEMARKLSRS